MQLLGNGGESSAAMRCNRWKADRVAGSSSRHQHMFRKHFANGKGLVDAKVGYIGGQSEVSRCC